jgi:hypothetical protein
VQHAATPDLPMLIGAKRTLARGQLAPAALLAGGLAWLAHIATDHAAGFGPRNPHGFQRG